MKLRQSYGDFLNIFHWDWYCILTFREVISPRLAFKTFNKWKVQLKKAAKQRIDYALFIEPTDGRNGIPHLHVLMHGVNTEKPYIWEQHWFAMAGRASIRLYDEELGAAYYLADKVLLDDVRVIFSKNLRCTTAHATF